MTLYQVQDESSDIDAAIEQAEEVFTLAADTDESGEYLQIDNAGNEQMLAWVDDYLQRLHQCSLEELLNPLSADNPCGTDLRLTPLYREINEARRADDPTLPRGDWDHELKRADWPLVTELTLTNLRTSSKDLQLLAWFIEAEVRNQGFIALMPALTLLNLMIQRFWESMQPDSANAELRYNIFRWIDSRVAAAINQVPLLPEDGSKKRYTGIDLDRALMYERLLENKKLDSDQLDGVSWKEFSQTAESMPDDYFQTMYYDIDAAFFAIGQLGQTVDRVFGEDSPSFSNLQEKLDKLLRFVTMELNRRGIFDVTANPAGEHEEYTERSVSTGQHSDAAMAVNNLGVPAVDSVNSREQAYRQLSELANYLAQIEPHSPVPCLIKQAVSWGKLSTAELYNELFLRNEGQLNLFEMLGLRSDTEAGNEQ